MPAPSWLTQLPRPALMAIGDSLVNGMRSMSINQDLAAHSIPAFLGGALNDISGLSGFQPATYQRPILIDVEAEVRQYAKWPFPIESLGLHLGNIKASVAQNARKWLDDFASGAMGGPTRFDNLAVAGALIDDVFHTTGAHLEARIRAMEPVIRQGNDPLNWSGVFPANDPLGPGNWGVGDVHMTFNARFLRDPTNRGGLEAMTILDIVAARKPKILVLDMGANHGLVSIALSQAGDKGIASLQKFAKDWAACARELSRLPDVDIVVMLLLPLPSQIPGLAPPNPGPGELPGPSRPDKYFDSYVSAIKPISGGSDYTGDQVAQFDKEVAAINAQVKSSTETAFDESGKHLEFVNLADLLGVYDYKQRKGQKLRSEEGREYSNEPLGPSPDRLRGGISGLDHAHPTKISYRYIAEAIRGKLLPHGIASRNIAITDSDDTFLTQPDSATLSVLDSLYPRPGPLARVESAELLAQKKEIDRLLFRAPWIY